MSEKSFPPSAEKVSKARKNGEVAHSKLLSSSFGLCGAAVGAYLLPCYGPLEELFRHAVLEMDSGVLVVDTFWAIFRGVIPPLLLGVCASVGISLLQTRGLLFLRGITPTLTQVGANAWFRRLKRGAGDGAVGILRVTIALCVAGPPFFVTSRTLQEILRLSPGLGVSWNCSYLLISTLLWECMIRWGVGLLVIGAVSYWLVRWRFFNRLRMSIHELREESREQEGDPHMKSARRHEHEVLSMSDLVARVRRAKVIIVERRPR